MDSEQGEGTTFQVFFPTWKKEMEDTGEKKPALADGQRMTILLVDDEEQVRKLTKRMLVRMGFEVFVAADGAEAVKLYKTHKDSIALVLLDLTMPHMDGEETFYKLREIEENVCVILSSGYSEEQIMNRFAGKGLAGFIQKPYQLPKLEERLRVVLPDAVWRD